jgi:hypothetical protein
LFADEEEASCKPRIETGAPAMDSQKGAVQYIRGFSTMAEIVRLADG